MSLDLLSTAPTGTDSKSLLNQSVSSLQTRFFTQELLKCLSACWLTAIAGGIVWCLIQPLLLATPGSDYRLSVIGGLLLLGSAFAFILAWKRTPKKGVVSLALDQALDLKERVTTAYLLSDKESSTVVGQALIEDVNERLTTLSLTEHFPIRLPEWGYLLPLLAVGFGLAWHYIPPLSTRRLVDLAQKDQAAVISEETREKVKEKLQTRKPTQSAGNKSNEKSQELQEFEAQREKLAQSKMETKEDAVDLVKQMTSLEEQMQKRDRQLAQKAEALKEQLKQVQRLSRNQKDQDGPLSKLNKALDRGDFKGADKEAKELGKQLAEQQKMDEQIEKIQKQLASGDLNPQEKEKLQSELNRLQKQKLTQEQRKQLKDQLKDLQAKIDRLTRDKKELAKELKEMAEKGLLDEQQLQRELDQLQEQMDQIDPKMAKNLEEVAEKLRKSLEAMEKGNEAEAARLLEEAVDKLAQCDPGAERDELRQQLQQLLESRRMVSEESSENNQGGQGAGRRPDGKPHDTRSEEQRVRSQLDKGALQVVDTVPGKGFKGPRTQAELSEEIHEAIQAAPDAIDRQRLPRSASEMAKGYFEKLRGKEKKQ